MADWITMCEPYDDDDFYADKIEAAQKLSTEKLMEILQQAIDDEELVESDFPVKILKFYTRVKVISLKQREALIRSLVIDFGLIED